MRYFHFVEFRFDACVAMAHFWILFLQVVVELQVPAHFIEHSIYTKWGCTGNVAKLRDKQITILDLGFQLHYIISWFTNESLGAWYTDG